MTQAIRVLTEIPADQIIRDGGTGNWSAALQKAAMYPYVVCVRHGNRPASPNDVPHKTAFLIGRISGTHETEEIDGKGNPRLFLAFDRYAEINVPEFWGDSQNPVGYVDLEESGIDVNSLSFKTVEKTHLVQGLDHLEEGNRIGLSFAEARLGLAQRYGVDARSIEILIRG
jgi:hypothetical protein